MEEEAKKNGYIGEYIDEVTYCNEKDRKKGDFLFKCSEDCEHN